MAKNVERNIKAIHEQVDLITNPNWREVTKTRYVHQNTNHTFIRIDAKNQVPRISMHDMPLNEYDLVAISDYNKGFLLEEDIAAILARHDNVFVDTKKILGSWAQKARYIKINNFEYERSKHALTPELDSKIICTKGGLGAQYRGTLYPVDKVEVKDSSGAGDSFFAALVVRYAETGDIEASIRFANECASQVVQHPGVTVIERPKSSYAQGKNI
jgi:sugar/nucleoside kinase (ribokinase family)